MNVVYLLFLALAWIAIECFIGGTRLLYSLPSYCLLSIAAILSIVSLVFLRRKRTPPDVFCVCSTLLLGAWVLFRAWRSPVEYLALPDFFMMLACLMTWLLTALYLAGAVEQSVLIGVLCAIAGLEVWVGMVQFIKDPGFMLFGLIRPHGYLRASGLYISPNNFAGFLVTVAIISLSLGIWSSWRVWVKILVVYIGVFCLVGVAISGSRGGYFATIGCLLSFAIGSIYAIRILDPRKFVPVALAASAGIAAVVAIAAFLMTHSDLLTHRMQTMVASDVRIYNWQAAVDHIRVSPWVGTGAGTHLIYGRLFRRPQIQADPVHAHCDYLELLAEYGIVGALCMGLFIAAHVRAGLRSYSGILRRRLIPSGLRQDNTFAIQLGALCAVAGLLIHSVVDFDMHIPGNALVFAFLFGILANPGAEQPGESHGPINRVNRGVAMAAGVLLPLLGLFMLWRGAPLIPSEYCAEQSRCALRDHRNTDSIQYARWGIGPAANPVPDPDAARPPDLLARGLARTGPNPKNPNFYFYMGESYRAIALGTPSPIMRILTLEKADTAFKAGLALFPQDEYMVVRDAQVLDALRRFPAADVLFQKALALDPNLAVIHQFYLIHLTAEGNQAAAAAEQARMKAGKTIEVDPDQKVDDPLQK